MDANLIVTYDPTHAGKAKQEVEELVGKADFPESEFEGVFLVRTKRDPKELVADLSETCQKEPYKFKYTYRWVPVDAWCRAEVAEMEKEIEKINSRIGEAESWKMDIGKRGSSLDTMELIEKLTALVSRPKVDLRNPQKIIKLEIVGNKAAVSLLGPEEYLNVTKLKVV